ncbi:MAG: glycosyltransferase family 39 protein [Candidatus Curtissbacteria bacterium]|nr:glycosyltransferase family 39 protein [Candidatus Curtissbacteria bacterium]
MEFLKTYTPVLMVLVLLSFLRFCRVLDVPIFLDEATYLSFADSIRNNPHNLFVSFPAAVLPVLPWFLALSYFIFGNAFNIFNVARILLTTTDIISAFFVFLIGRELVDKRFGFLSLILYMLIPLNFFHGRLIMLEPLMEMLFLIGLYFLIKIYKKIYDKKYSIKLILTSALFLSLSFLTKPLALVSFGSLLFLPPFFILKRKVSVLMAMIKMIPAFFVFLFFTLLILPFAIVIFPGFENYHAIGGNNDVVFNFKQNLWRSYWWIKAYFPIPILFAIFFSSILGLFKKDVLVVWFSLWALSVILIDSLVGTKFFPRHLFPVAAPASFLLAYLVYEIMALRRWMGFLALGFVLIPLLQKDLLILSDAKNSGLALEDKQQFYEDWTSGVGLAEIGSFLNSVSRREKITLFVENDTLLTWALPNIYLEENVIVYPLPNHFPSSLNNFLENNSNTNINFILLNKTADAPEDWPVFLILSQDKGPHRKINLYKYHQK